MGNSIYSSGTTYILGNDFQQNSTANTFAANGIRTIIASGGGTFIIANNFFGGYSAPTASGNASEIIAIRCGSPVEAYYNTIVMNNINATSGSLYRGIYVAAGSPKVYNNIVITEEDDFANYCIAGTPGESDFNNFYRTGTTNACVGLYTGVPQPTLADWQTASGLDTYSASVAVNFVSTTDLHLTGASIGDVNLTGFPIVGITTDIDGDTRGVNYPYMGADENSATPLPVEMTTFSAVAQGQSVMLKWITAQEINSYKFDIERKSAGTNWTKIGEVQAQGNSSVPTTYTFADNNLVSGKYSYRLKIIDNDGSFEYSKVVEAEVSVPNEFSLSQNYPNPFNPTTKIDYSIPEAANVKILIYSVTGELVTELVNEYQNAGKYTVEFNASDLASGTYVYRIITNNYIETKKMILLK